MKHDELIEQLNTSGVDSATNFELFVEVQGRRIKVVGSKVEVDGTKGAIILKTGKVKKPRAKVQVKGVASGGTD